MALLPGHHVALLVVSVAVALLVVVHVALLLVLLLVLHRVRLLAAGVVLGRTLLLVLSRAYTLELETEVAKDYAKFYNYGEGPY